MTRYRDRASVTEILTPIAIFVFAGLFGLAVLFGMIQFQRSGCYRWGEITGREVQFRRVTLMPECFAKTGDGRWLPRESLREVVD